MMIRFDLMEFYKHRFYKHMDLYFVLFLYYHYGYTDSSDNQVFVNIHATTVEANDFHCHIKKTPFMQKERWH